MKSYSLPVLSALIALALPGRARAVVTVYTTPSQYTAATSANTLYTFPATGPGGTVLVSPSFTDGPLTFSSPVLRLASDGAYTGVNTYLDGTASPETVALAGTGALAFVLGGVSSGSVTLTINGVTATTLSLTGQPTSNFVGFTDTVPITSVGLTVSAAVLDVLSFQVGSPVPEPSTWALLGVGVGLLGFLTLRQRVAILGDTPVPKSDTWLANALTLAAGTLTQCRRLRRA